MVLAFLASLSLDRPNILDVGCGPGWFTDNLARHGTVTGLDLSEEAINMARSRFPKVTFMAGNVYEVRLPEAHFDVVVSQEVLDHVEDQSAFISRVAGLLKPGGHLLLSYANKFVMDRARDDFPPQPSGHISHYLTGKDFKQLLRPHFQLLRSRTIIPVGHEGLLRIINSHKLNVLARPLIGQQHLDHMKERMGLGFQVISLAQKRTQ